MIVELKIVYTPSVGSNSECFWMWKQFETPHRSSAAVPETMATAPATDQSHKKRKPSLTTILRLDHDTLCMIFAYLDMFDLVRCSVVCKFWYSSLYLLKIECLNGLSITLLAVSCNNFPFIEDFNFIYLIEIAYFFFPWRNAVFNNSRLLQKTYYKQISSTMGSGASALAEKPLRIILQELAMQQHRMALKEGQIHIDQWRGHSSR